jgi:ElaB/YqjD/DUF883 family membrane-anchored ribosome-binding protein
VTVAPKQVSRFWKEGVMSTVILEKRGYEAPTFRRVAADAGRRVMQASHDAKMLKFKAGAALETRMYDAAHRIRKHPFAAVAAAFAIGVPLGLLAGWVSARHRRSNG